MIYFECSEDAQEFVARLKKNEGEIILLLSHGCCDGTSVFCTLKSDFKSKDSYQKIAQIAQTDFLIPKTALPFFENQKLFLKLQQGKNPNEFSLDFEYGFYLRLHTSVCLTQ